MLTATPHTPDAVFALDRLGVTALGHARRSGLHAAGIAIVVLGPVVASHTLLDRSTKSHAESRGSRRRGEFRHSDKDQCKQRLLHGRRPASIKLNSRKALGFPGRAQ